MQAKLQQCINSGQLNSFDRISNLFAGNTTNTDATTTNDEGDDDVVMTSTSGVSNTGKDASKIPTKKSSKSTKKTMVGYSQKMIGQYGDQTRKKVSEKRSKVRSSNGSSSSRRSRSASKGRSGDGRSGGLRSSSKKSRK